MTDINIKCCDNLELMAEISDKSIDLIYCDILYGTGRKHKNYQDLPSKQEAVEEHYRPRIQEMHRILKDTGSIYLQMDTRINHWVRCIMDNIFGYRNYRNEIIWRMGWVSGFKMHSNTFVRNHDVIVRYSKTDDFTFNKYYIPHTAKILDSNKGYKERRERKGYCIEDTWNCSEKDRLNSIMIMSFAKKRYETEKPEALIERIVKASSNEGDWVADFYAGSFTTAKVCQDQNRNFIGCDISREAVKIGRNRIKNKRKTNI